MKVAVLGLSALTWAAAAPTVAQPTEPATLVVSKVQLRLVSRDRPPELLAGRLWRYSINGEARPVAEVDPQGVLDEPYRCAAGDRLVGQPYRHVSTNSQAKPCRDGVEFEFNVIRTVRLEAPPGGEDAVDIAGYLAAYSDLALINRKAAMVATGEEQVRFLTNAQAAEMSITWASARVLGHDQWEALVTLDPAQGNRLVLSKEGVRRVAEVQRTNGLQVTGQLDFATLQLIGKWTKPESIKEPGQRLFVLPREMLRDKAVLASSNKSAALVELSRAAANRD